jgi:hypothetical protein
MAPRNTWPKFGKKKGVPRQRVVPKREIALEESSWFRYATPERKVELMRLENAGRRKK